MFFIKYSIKKCILRYLYRSAYDSDIDSFRVTDDGAYLLLDVKAESFCVDLEIVSWWKCVEFVPSCAGAEDELFVTGVVDESWMLLRAGLSRLLGSSNSS